MDRGLRSRFRQRREQRRWNPRGIAIEGPNQKTHLFTERTGNVVAHLRLLLPPQGRETLRPIPEGFREWGGRQLPACAVFHNRRGRLERQQGDRLLDPRLGEIDPGHDLRNRQPGFRAFDDIENSFDFIARRKSRLDEIVEDLRFLGAAQENAVG